MSELSNPHDRFFKETLTRQEVGRDFLIHYLPGELVALLDVDSLEICKDSFVDQELREHFSDVLYKVDLIEAGSTYVYILFEHKSFPEPMIGLHLLRYMVKIWDQALKGGESRPFSPIIPVVVYHGKAKWKIGTEFSSLFDTADALIGYLPNFQYLLCDLSRYSDEDIKGIVSLRVAFLLLKHIFSDDLAERLPEILALLRNLLDKRSGLEYLQTALRYVASGTDSIGKERLEEVVIEVLKNQGGDIMPTIAEQWIQEGMQQGIQQGIQQGMKEGIQQGIQQGMKEGIRQGVKEGLLKAIRLGLELRFGSEGLRVFPEIRKIEDTDVLDTISEAVKSAESIGALERIYK
jgi:predicted transposase/invertase (TIGR01784 family)